MRKSLCAAWIMVAILMMTGVSLQGAPAGAPKPYGLMTDLIERTDVVYAGRGRDWLYKISGEAETDC